MPDEIDAQIVAHLESDARVTSRRIADALELPETTIRNRMHRLLRSRQVSSTVFVHPDLADERLLYQVKLTLEPEIAAEAIAALPHLATAPWIAIMPTDGRLVVQFSAADVAEMVENVDRVRALPGIEHAETLLVTRIYVGRMWNSGSYDQQWPSTPERTIDAVDREIIRTLRADGRMSYTHLAAIIGLTVPAARRRVLRLVADGVMRFVTQLNDRSISRAEASIDLTVAGSARAAVIDSLTTRRSIRYVIEQTGHHDLACYVVTDSIASLAAEIASITADLRVLDAHAEPYVILRDETSWTR